ncbi:Rid family detoxifying hydrolase [uncultured Brevundimonas sp.]|uniref:RidA family protein n=1 Tax=uncultured Brevundimonas sp. TaxID=213418 RepID=UPI00260B9769|nr:Rid family detoxifying hydrolase [uncultured Brevundimonas sp.]
MAYATVFDAGETPPESRPNRAGPAAAALSACLLVAGCVASARLPAPPPRAITGASLPALGPYSQAVAAGDFVFISGVVAFDPAAGAFAAADIDSQMRQVFANLDAVLAAAGLTREDVVKTTVFLRDAGDMAAMNRLYGEYFTGFRPARTTVPGADWGRDDLRIEIEAVAVRGRAASPSTPTDPPTRQEIPR